MKVVVFAYFFLLDYIINILYTIFFASIWFLIVTKADSQSSLAATVMDADMTKVHAISSPDTNPLKGQHASVVEETGTVDPGSAGTTFGVVSIELFWVVKIYLVLLVFSYARSLVLRSHLSALSFSLNAGIWERAQRWMLSSDYWREDDEDYKQTSRRVLG